VNGRQTLHLTVRFSWKRGFSKAASKSVEMITRSGKGRSMQPSIISTLACLGLLFLVSASAMAGGAEKSGAAIFKSKCGLCHGADGAGNTALGKQLQAANLRSKDVQKKSDAELHKVVHDGNGNMPPFADQLRDDEISQVIQYVRGLGKTTKK
jgi:cytochrome c6